MDVCVSVCVFVYVCANVGGQKDKKDKVQTGSDYTYVYIHTNTLT